MCHTCISRENLHVFRGANKFGAFCCHSINTRASPRFSFTIHVSVLDLGSFTCITQHTGPTALCPIRRTKQLWLSVLLKDTSAVTGQAVIQTHILTTPELESNALDRSATKVHVITTQLNFTWCHHKVYLLIYMYTRQIVLRVICNIFLAVRIHVILQCNVTVLKSHVQDTIQHMQCMYMYTYEYMYMYMPQSWVHIFGVSCYEQQIENHWCNSHLKIIYKSIIKHFINTE